MSTWEGCLRHRDLLARRLPSRPDLGLCEPTCPHGTYLVIPEATQEWQDDAILSLTRKCRHHHAPLGHCYSEQSLPFECTLFPLVLGAFHTTQPWIQLALPREDGFIVTTFSLAPVWHPRNENLQSFWVMAASGHVRWISLQTHTFNAEPGQQRAHGHRSGWHSVQCEPWTRRIPFPDGRCKGEDGLQVMYSPLTAPKNTET